MDPTLLAMLFGGGGLGTAGLGSLAPGALGVAGAPMDMSTGVVNPGIGVEGAGMPLPPEAPPLPASIGGTPIGGTGGTSGGPGNITPFSTPTNPPPPLYTPGGVNSFFDKAQGAVQDIKNSIGNYFGGTRGGAGGAPTTPPLSGEAVPYGGMSGPGMGGSSSAPGVPPATPGAGMGGLPVPGGTFAPPGTPMPSPRPVGIGQSLEPAAGNYGGSPETNPLLKPIGSATAGTPNQNVQNALKALSQIKAPGVDVVKPSTPAAPHPTPLGASELVKLLMSLNPATGRSLRMPTTLGQSLEGKPAAWGPLYG